MYKMLIVDDNMHDRNGIHKMVDWSSLGIGVVAKFENGKRALEYILSHTVDIVISDVEMPVLNGIEMLKEIRRQGLQTKVIFVSCYDEFEFAKSAIEMEAIGYVLKPIIKSELVSCVKKVLNLFHDISVEKQKREQLIARLNDSFLLIKDNYFRGLLFHQIKGDEEVEFQSILNIVENESLRVCLIEICEIKENSDSLHNSDIFMASCLIKEMLENKTTRNGYEFFPIILNADQVAVILKYDMDKEEQALEYILDFKSSLLTEFGIVSLISISNSGSVIDDLSKLYHQANKIFQMQIYSKDTIRFYSELTDDCSSTEMDIDLQELQKNVIAVLSGGKAEEIKHFIDLYIGEDQANYSQNYVKRFIYSLINLLELRLLDLNLDLNNIISRKDLWAKLSRFETIVDIKQWIANIILLICNEVNSQQYTKNFKITSAIKEYIAENYQKHLTIDTIAENIHFSGTHANNIFKSETGKTILEHLTEFRMEKAKELLKQPESKIYVVAQEVGYINKSHFCMLFKQYTGLMPNEFKNFMSK